VERLKPTFRHAGYILALGVAYAAAWWLIDPPSLAHNRIRPFLLDPIYLCRYARHAGGWLEFLTSFMVQLYRYPAAATLMILGIMGLHALLFSRLLHLFNARRPGPSALLMTLLLLLTWRHYTTLVTVMAIILALSGTLSCLMLRHRHPLVQIGGFAGLNLALSYLAGGPATLMALWVILHTVLLQKRFRTSLALLIIACLAPPVVRWFCYEPSLAALCLRWIPLDNALRKLPVELVGFHLLYAATPLLAAGLARGVSRLDPVVARRGLRAVTAAGFMAVFLLAGFLDWRYRDTNRLMVADRLVEAGQWDAALAQLSSLPGSGDLRRHLTLRSLGHAGRLLHDLFRHPQQTGPDIILLSNPEMDILLRIARKRSDAYYDLGLVNESERWTHEAFSDQGEIDCLLNRLATINVIKGRPEAAAIFLETLALNPFARRQAHTRLAAIRADPLLSQDPVIGQIRAGLSDTDYAGPWQTDEVLQQVLERNPRHKLAYDYLLAGYLLDRRVGDFAARIGRYKEFYPVLPPACEEACITYQLRHGQPPPGMPDWRPDPATLRRFNTFLALCRKPVESPRTLWNALVGDFGTTFWFYDLFGRTGAGLPVTDEELAGLTTLIKPGSAR